MEDLRARARRGERGEADPAGDGPEVGEHQEQPEPERQCGEGEAEVPGGAVRRDPRATGHARDAAEPPGRFGAAAEGLHHQDE